MSENSDRRLNDVVSVGMNLRPDRVEQGEARPILERLEHLLEAKGYHWSDVGTLMVFSTRWFAAKSGNIERANADFIQTLGTFADDRGWRPSLLGCSALSGFVSCGNLAEEDVDNGYLISAFCTRLLDRLPVGFYFARSPSTRTHAATTAVRRAADKARRELGRQAELQVDEDWIYENGTAVLFSTGSGHIAQDENVQFRECFAMGQHLMAFAAETDLLTIGGHASNNRAEAGQLQLLFYSEEIAAGRIEYHFEHAFGAVTAVLPNVRPRVALSHPYRADAEQEDPLQVEYCEDDAYGPGQFFYVKRINGLAVEDFFATHWGLDEGKVHEMAASQAPIPSRPELHTITLASTSTRWERESAWPNVPVWFEVHEHGGRNEIVLRLVRAEFGDAKMFLMRLDPSELETSMNEFMNKVRNTPGAVGSFSCLCESRKYVLMERDENGEADSAVRLTPHDQFTVGVYLNGEYSTGRSRSIGYHNYSQISGIFVRSMLA